MSRQLRKIETSHNQTTQNKHYHKNKGKSWKFKENYVREKTTLPSLRNIELRKVKT